MTTNPILPFAPTNSNVPAITFRLILCLAALCSGVAGAQTLSSGGNYDGTILLGQTNTWTFSANVGDRIVLRGAALTSTNNFEPWLRIYNPTGVLIADSGINVGGLFVVELALTATNSGTFTVTINDSGFGGFGGTGAYRLYFAQFPGAFVVPSGDEGGSLTNGGNHDGTIQVGDLDLWWFTANAGDRIVLRGAALTSANNFEPWLRIYNPAGLLVADRGINVGRPSRGGAGPDGDQQRHVHGAHGRQRLWRLYRHGRLPAILCPPPRRVWRRTGRRGRLDGRRRGQPGHDSIGRP